MIKASDFLIDEIRSQDLDEIIAIEQSSFPTPWPRQVFDMEIKSLKSFTRVSRNNGTVVGYIIAWKIYHEAHILNVAVHREYRRLGVAQSLLLDCLTYFSNNGAITALLEVRSKNDMAINLYEKIGFKAIGLRRGYYCDTGDDAIVMELDLEYIKDSSGF